MLCLIPARGGSKELPGKNCKILRGKPLIAYTIEAAKRAKSLSRVIVTTDSREIAEIAREYGAETPFLRPAHLAKDNSMAMDAYIHAIEFLEKEEGIQTEKFVVLLPTAPLRDEKDIDEAVEIFKKQKGSEFLDSIRNSEPFRGWAVKKQSQLIGESNPCFRRERAAS